MIFREEDEAQQLNLLDVERNHFMEEAMKTLAMQTELTEGGREKWLVETTEDTKEEVEVEELISLCAQIEANRAAEERIITDRQIITAALEEACSNPTKDQVEGTSTSPKNIQKKKVHITENNLKEGFKSSFSQENLQMTYQS